MAISAACFGRPLHNTGIPGLIEGQREKDHLTLISLGQYLPSVDLKVHHLTHWDLHHPCHFSRGKLRHKVGKGHLCGLTDNQRHGTCPQSHSFALTWTKMTSGAWTCSSEPSKCLQKWQSYAWGCAVQITLSEQWSYHSKSMESHHWPSRVSLIPPSHYHFRVHLARNRIAGDTSELSLEHPPPASSASFREALTFSFCRLLSWHSQSFLPPVPLHRSSGGPSSGKVFYPSVPQGHCTGSRRHWCPWVAGVTFLHLPKRYSCL